jgi:hypothetical protein
MTKTYQFKFDKRAGGNYTELNDNGEISIVDKGFNPSLTSELEAKKAEYEAMGFVEKTSDIINDFREAETWEEKETILKNIPQ